MSKNQLSQDEINARIDFLSKRIDKNLEELKKWNAKQKRKRKKQESE